MHVESWHSRDELAALIRGEKNARVATRLRAVLLALKGRTNKEIADDLSVSPRSVQSWVERYTPRSRIGTRMTNGELVPKGRGWSWTARVRTTFCSA